MVELVRSGRSPDQLAREFEPSAQSIRNWVTQADRDDGRRNDGIGMRPGLPTSGEEVLVPSKPFSGVEQVGVDAASVYGGLSLSD